MASPIDPLTPPDIWSGELVKRFYTNTVLDALGDRMESNRRANMANGTEQERFRSFAERYVVERASTFNSLDPRQDAWLAVQDAVSIYDNIAQVSNRYDPAPSAQQAGVGSSANAQWPAGTFVNPPRKIRTLSMEEVDKLMVSREGAEPDRFAMPALKRLRALAGLNKGAQHETETPIKRGQEAVR